MLGFLAIFILTGFSAAAWLVFYRYIDVVDQESEQTALKALVFGCVSIVPLILLEQFFLRFPESDCLVQKLNLDRFQTNHGARNLMILPAELEHGALI